MPELRTLSDILDSPKGWEPGRLYFITQENQTLSIENEPIMSDEKWVIEKLFSRLRKENPPFARAFAAKVDTKIAVLNREKGLRCDVEDEFSSVRPLFSPDKIEEMIGSLGSVRWVYPLFFKY